MFLEHPVRAKKKSSILMSEFGFYYHYLKLHHLVLYYAHDGSAKIMSHEGVGVGVCVRRVKRRRIKKREHSIRTQTANANRKSEKTRA